MRGSVIPGGTRKMTLAVVTALAVTGLVAAGCSSKGGGSGSGAGENGAATSTTTPGKAAQNLEKDTTPKNGGKLVIGLEAETNGWNPAVNGWAASGHFVGSAVFDPLATLDDKGQPVPYLARKLDRNDDGTVWTITLPSDVTFHDGTKLTAAAVKKNLEAHKASGTTGGAVTAIDSVEAPNDTTVVVKMNQPWLSFPYILTTQVGYVAAPSQLDDPDGSLKPVGTGPFVFDEWVQGTSFKAKKNPSYWQKGKPHLDQIEFRPIPDAQKRLQELRDGNVDLIHTLRAGDIATLRGGDLKMVEVATGEETFVALNTAAEPFNDPNARQAVAVATDTARYLKEIGGGVSPEANGPFAPGQLGYRPTSGYPAFDLAKAKQLVADYEKAHGKPLSFTYKGGATVDDARGQQLLKQMWEAAGMKVELVGVKQETQLGTGVIGDYQAIDWRNFGSVDPDGDYVWWHSKESKPVGQISTNIARYDDPQLDKALDDARATTDTAKRDQLYATVAERMNAGTPYIWLLRANWALVANNRVNGIGAASNGSLSTLGAKTWVADLWVQ